MTDLHDDRGLRGHHRATPAKHSTPNGSFSAGFNVSQFYDKRWCQSNRMQDEMDAMENVRMKEKQNLQNEINRLTIDMQSVFHRSALESVPTTTHRSSKLSSPTCKASATRWTCFNRDMHSASKHSNWIYDPASMHAARMHGPEQKSEEMNQFTQDMQRVELEQEKKYRRCKIRRRG